MTFQYFFFDTYPGYFVEALPLAVIIAAVYGVIRFRKDKTVSTSRKVFSCLFMGYMVGLVELVLLLDVMRYSWYWIIYHMDGGNAPRFFDLTFNMIPDFWNHINSEVVGNLIMFIPFGILYSLAKKKPSMLLCGCEITAELVYGTIADSMFLGAIGFLHQHLQIICLFRLWCHFYIMI